MKMVLCALVLLASTSAFADYFGCDLRVNGTQRVDDEAPYRGREVRVEIAGYACAAVIDQNIEVTTELTSLLTAEGAEARGRASAAVRLEAFNPATNSIDVVTCKCGLR